MTDAAAYFGYFHRDNQVAVFPTDEWRRLGHEDARSHESPCHGVGGFTHFARLPAKTGLTPIFPTARSTIEPLARHQQSNGCC
jgi:hypothetical protein